MSIPTEAWVLPRPRRDCYVGSFPLHFEKKLHRLLGEPEKVLHPFGGLSEIGEFVDLNETTAPTYVGDAHDLTNLRTREGEPHSIEDDTYDLVILDPPYSDEECETLYAIDTPLRWNTFVGEAVRVCKPGGHVAIYHRVQAPRPEGTRLVHRVVVLTRTFHAARICMIFEKLP